jgi:hypothetical protein
MAAEGLRLRLTELLRFAVPPVPDLLVCALRRRDGYVEQVVNYEGDEGDVPALLLIPEHPCGAGVVVHHQHHAQWQFGKCASVLFHAALDERIAFAVVSGSACTYKERMTHGVGIDCAQAIPGLLELGDLDDIAGLVAPRPLLLCSADDDKYSRDAPRIAEAAACAYRNAGAPEALQHYRARGGHALTEERFDAIVDWVIAQLSENGSIGGQP